MRDGVKLNLKFCVDVIEVPHYAFVHEFVRAVMPLYRLVMFALRGSPSVMLALEDWHCRSVHRDDVGFWLAFIFAL